MRITLCGTIVAACIGSGASANMITNGDFESNSAGGTMFNISNPTWTGTMSDSTGFGSAAELDIVTGLDFGIAPQSGSWKAGLHTRSDLGADAFSLDLSTSVVSGNQYTLDFYVVGEPDFGSVLGAAEIGLSSSASDFGSLVYSGSATGTGSWTHHTHVFTATANASFLTVRSEGTANVYVFIDNISLTPTPGTVSLLGVAGLFAIRRRR